VDNHYECPYCGWGSNDIGCITKEFTSYEKICEECGGAFYITVTYSAYSEWYYTHTYEDEKAKMERQKEYKDTLKEFIL